jgi:DNA-directed RNA polymerase specialized sigma24 family protein
MDRDLVAAARRGDQTAFMDLVRPRSERLFGIALQILRDIDRAEDALQDALVIAWRDLRGLRDPDRFDAWLRRVLVNVCIREAARQRRRAMNLRVLPVDGPAAPDDLLSLADRDQLERGSAGSRPINGRFLCSITSWAMPRPRSPRRSASRPGLPAPDFSTPIAPCGPPSRPTPD